MSKKIIYLLSLLMALSLVFAGCKKAGTAPGGEGPTKEDEVKPPSNLGNTGLSFKFNVSFNDEYEGMDNYVYTVESTAKSWEGAAKDKGDWGVLNKK